VVAAGVGYHAAIVRESRALSELDRGVDGQSVVGIVADVRGPPHARAIAVDAVATTPLLGQVMLPATWTNTLEHAADPHDSWGQGVVGSNLAVPTTEEFPQVTASETLPFG